MGKRFYKVIAAGLLASMLLEQVPAMAAGADPKRETDLEITASVTLDGGTPSEGRFTVELEQVSFAAAESGKTELETVSRYSTVEFTCPDTGGKTEFGYVLAYPDGKSNSGSFTLSPGESHVFDRLEEGTGWEVTQKNTGKRWHGVSCEELPEEWPEVAASDPVDVEHAVRDEADAPDAGPVRLSARNDADGGIVFPLGSLPDGSYRFRMRQQGGGDGSILYDPSVYDVAVKVKDGKMSASYLLDGKTVDKAVFRNERAGGHSVTVVMPKGGCGAEFTYASQPGGPGSFTLSPGGSHAVTGLADGTVWAVRMALPDGWACRTDLWYGTIDGEDVVIGPSVRNMSGEWIKPDGVSDAYDADGNARLAERLFGEPGESGTGTSGKASGIYSSVTEAVATPPDAHGGPTGNALDRIADPSSMTGYQDALLTDGNSRYAGRLWADKSVFAYGDTGAGTEDGVTWDGEVLSVDGDSITLDDDFLTAASVMGSSFRMGEPAPLDLMFCVDVSGSMGTKLDGTGMGAGKVGTFEDFLAGDLSINKAVAALNTAIDTLLGASPKTRFGIVVYGATAAVLLPLGHYTKSGDTDWVTAWYVPDDTYTQGMHFCLNAKVVSDDGRTVSLFADNAGPTNAESHDGENKPAQGNAARHGTSGHTSGDGTQEEPYHVGHLTNQQAGLAAAMEQLANSDGTTWESASEPGTRYRRVPALIHLSDGQATDLAVVMPDAKPDGQPWEREASNWNRVNWYYDNAYNTWSEVLNWYNSYQYSSESATVPVVLQTVMTAAYYSAWVEAHYNSEPASGNKIEFRNIYSCYMEAASPLGGMAENVRSIVEGIMDPSVNLTGDVQETSYLREVRGYLDDFAGGTDLNKQFIDMLSNKDRNDVHVTLSITCGEEGIAGGLVTDDDVARHFGYVPEGNFAAVTPQELGEQLSGWITSMLHDAFVPAGGTDAFGGTDDVTYADPVGLYLSVKHGTDPVSVNGEKADMFLSLFGESHALKAAYAHGPNADASGLPIAGEVQGMELDPETDYVFYEFTDPDRDEVKGNPCYGGGITYRLSDIRVWTEDKGGHAGDGYDVLPDHSYDETLFLHIPSAVLPIAVYGINGYEDGRPVWSDNLNDAVPDLPLRLYYAVGARDDVTDEDGNIDRMRIDPDYAAGHLSEDGRVLFRSGHWSGSSYDGYVDSGHDAYSIGDAAVSFSPAEDNRYYLYQKSLPLYRKAYRKQDGILREAVAADSHWEGGKVYRVYDNQDAMQADSGSVPEGQIALCGDDLIRQYDPGLADKHLFLAIEYYEKGGKLPSGADSAVPVQYAVSRKGSEFGSGYHDVQIAAGSMAWWYDPDTGKSADLDLSAAPEYGKPEDGDYVLAAKPGGIRVGDLSQNVRVKTGNPTETAGDATVPVIDTHSDPGNVIIDAYLGNNGRFLIENTGALTVMKSVTGNVPEDKMKDFPFRVELSDTSVNGTFGKDDPETAWDDRMEFGSGVAKFTLKDGESKTAYGLPDGVTYTVTESGNEGFVVTKEGDAGTINGGVESECTFINHRTVFILPYAGGIGRQRILLLGASVVIISFGAVLIMKRRKTP